MLCARVFVRSVRTVSSISGKNVEKNNNFLINVSVMTCDALASCLSLSIDKAQEGCSVIKCWNVFKRWGYYSWQCFHFL